jgi:hypothetical protein
MNLSGRVSHPGGVLVVGCGPTQPGTVAVPSTLRGISGASTSALNG